MKERFLRVLLVAGCLYATSCTLNRETIGPDVEVEGEEVAVTFSLSAEGQMVSTRADNTGFDEMGGKTHSNISKGQLIDKVVYAVYVKVYETDQDGKPKWTGRFRLLDQYGDGTDGLGEGQALLPSTENLQKEGGETLTLRLMRGQEYVIGFWAQNSECLAYDSQNLEAVIVDYKAKDGLAPNNDEIRDAFCQVYTFTAQVGVTEKVVLKRALAQVNVGTAGWDYNNEVVYGNSYAYSKIEMTGLNNQLNVLTEEVSKTADFNGAVTYDWAVLPAYIGSETYPNYPEGIEDDSNRFATWLMNPENDKEFLYVKLLTDKPEYLPYITAVPEDETVISSEVFKYLSMCYVLAPAGTYAGNSDTSDGLAIDELKFSLAEFIENGEGYVYEDDDKKVTAPAPVRFTLSTVPVQRNWRTNILGGTHGGTDHSLFDPRAISLWIDLAPDYDGDHFHYDSGDGRDSGWTSKEWPKEEE